MSIRKSTLGLLVVVVALSFGLSAWASGQKTSGQSLQFMALKANPKASGTIYLGRDHLKISATGLKPDSVYTVWFVNKKPKMQKAGAGNPPFMFKTNSAGEGTYDASLSKSPFGKWGMIMVVLHPTGDPKDMKNMVGAFAARIPKAGN